MRFFELMSVARAGLVLMLPLVVMGCRENRVPNGVVSEAVDEMKLAGLSSDARKKALHLDRAIKDFERVKSEFPWSRAARFLDEGGKFNGLTLEALKAQRASLFLPEPVSQQSPEP